jgi:hypothetical protein
MIMAYLPNVNSYRIARLFDGPRHLCQALIVFSNGTLHLS